MANPTFVQALSNLRRQSALAGRSLNLQDWSRRVPSTDVPTGVSRTGDVGSVAPTPAIETSTPAPAPAPAVIDTPLTPAKPATLVNPTQIDAGSAGGDPQAQVGAPTYKLGEQEQKALTKDLLVGFVRGAMMGGPIGAGVGVVATIAQREATRRLQEAGLIGFPGYSEADGDFGGGSAQNYAGTYGYEGYSGFGYGAGGYY